MMLRRAILLIVLCIVGALAIADSYRRRTPAEKVTDAELIVHGVAVVQVPLLTNSKFPTKCSCTVQVLETLWPTNALVTNTVTVEYWWPNPFWPYTSQTGVYFFMRTSTALKIARQIEKRRLLRIPITDDFLGTNMWFPLDRFDDWYEPATNLTNVRMLIGTLK
jgi:hypothetical protein